MKNLTRLPLLFTLLLFLPAVMWGHDVTAADQQTLSNGDLWSYIYVGAKHMLTGYDHLLFLVGVIFYLSSFKDILKTLDDIARTDFHQMPNDNFYSLQDNWKAEIDDRLDDIRLKEDVRNEMSI